MPAQSITAAGRHSNLGQHLPDYVGDELKVTRAAISMDDGRQQRLVLKMATKAARDSVHQRLLRRNGVHVAVCAS